MSVSRYIPKPQFFTSAGALANGYKVFYYATGTQNKVNTYTTAAGNVANANPIVLNSRGENPNGGIYLTDGTAYDAVYALATDTDPPTSPLWTDPATFGQSSADLASTSDVAKGDALIGVKRTATGAVAETLHTFINRREFDVEEFGDTSTAIGTLAAFNAAFATGKAVRFEASSYTLSGPLVLTAGMRGHGSGLNKTTLTFQNTDGIKFTPASANDGYLDLEGFTVSTTATTANNTTKGMDLTNVNYSRFVDIAVKYHQKGWYLARGSAGAYGCFFNKLTDTFAYFNQIGYEFNDVASDSRVNSNTLINPHVEAEYIWPAAIGYSITGYGNRIYNPYASGLQNNAQAVTSITSAATTATVTQTAHGYNTGDYITIYGADQTGYVGIFPITKTGADTYTYTVASGLVTPATGTIKAASLSQISAFMLFAQGSASAPTTSVMASLGVYSPYIESTPIWGFCIPNTTSSRYGNIVVSPLFDGGACLAGNFHDLNGELAVLGPDFNRLTTSLTVMNGDVVVGSTNRGFQNLEGNNTTQGAATLVAGTATVSTVAVTATSRIFLSTQVLGTVAAPKPIAVTARTPGTSFVITSSDATDTSTIAWELFEAAP